MPCRLARRSDADRHRRARNLRRPPTAEVQEWFGDLIYLLATAEIPFHVDVNVGDPVYPEPQAVDIPCLLGGSIRLRGYPLVAVMAEKLVTAMQRGVANTSWRDYADVLLLVRDRSVDGDDLHGALTTVAAHRRFALTPLAPLLSDFPGIAQPRWARWRANQETREALPGPFDDVRAGRGSLR